MKYRLKDKDLQDLLDQISAEDFSAQLKEVASFKDHPNPFARTRTVYFDLNHDTPVMLSVEITPEMVEKVKEYNPKAWNNYPEVMPPTNVLMRVEIQELGRPKPIKTSGTYDGSRWSFFAHGYCSPCDIRFRPWDDEGEA